MLPKYLVLNLVHPGVKSRHCGSKVNAPSFLDPFSLSRHTHTHLPGHPQLSAHLSGSLPACRHGGSAHCILFHIQYLHRAPPLPSSHVLVHKPTAHTQGPFRESRGNYVTCLQAHSGSSSHNFPGSQGLFLSCPQATLLNISWDEPFYHL